MLIQLQTEQRCIAGFIVEPASFGCVETDAAGVPAAAHFFACSNLTFRICQQTEAKRYTLLPSLSLPRFHSINPLHSQKFTSPLFIPRLAKGKDM